MSNAFIALPADMTVRDAITDLRSRPERPPMFYYLYLVQPGTEYLLGVVTVQDLVLAEAATPLRDIMERDVLQIAPDAPAEDAARLMAEYNLLALPVVDVQGTILGVITADDAMQVILPDEWKRRLPKIYR
jgi:magnesium transporter